MKTQFTRVLSLLLAAIMVIGIMPAAAFAAEANEEASETVPVTEAVEQAEATETTETEAETEAAEAEADAEVTEEAQDTEAAELTVDSGIAVYSEAGMPSNMTVISDKESTLAPGITLNEVVVYDKDGNRVEIYVATADLSVETVGVYANYLNNQNEVLGMSKLTEQVAAAEAKHAEPYSVVSGINASYYNMTTGKPTGTFVMEGNDITTESEGNKYSFFAILKDGTAFIGGKNEYSTMKDQIQEAVGGYIHLIEDGKICSGLDAKTKYPRQTVGITADGRVITMTADGNQAPKSIGLTVQEQAEVMLALGCVEAVHLDGGGSCTYGAKPEGEDSFRILSSPSDGSERSVSNTLIFVSTAVPDGAFDHATLTAETEYVTPGSTVSVSAVGVDAAGGSADIPAEISWQLADSAMGSVENGVFTSNGTAGDAVVQMVYGGEVVGETIIHVVVPTSLEFNNTVITVPYGKSVDLGITAYYGVNEVTLKEGDISFELDNAAAGTISGFTFTACEENDAVTATTVTATLIHNTELTATAEISMGKGSDVIFDFEDGTNQDVFVNETPGTKYNYVFPETNNYVVTAENGKVHSGSYALAADINYGNSLESGYMKTSVYTTQAMVFENAVSVGCWIYIPDEWVGLWARWTLLSITGFNADGTPIWGSAVNGNTMDTTAGGTGIVYTFDEPGWHYLYVDTSAYGAVGCKANAAMMQFYISDRDGSAYGYTAAAQSNIPGKFTVYIDDITVDYSSAVDDREAPVFSDITYAVSGMADAAILNNQTVTSNTVTFAASVADYTGKANYTGINASTVKAYIDGVEVDAVYSNGIVSVSDYVLTNGKHVIKFAAEDKMGNYGCQYGYVTVNAEASASTVKLVASDPDASYIKLSSIYNMDLVATAIEEVQSVVVSIDLDNNSTWQLDHMILADGFDASYSIGYDNIATITITRTGENDASGEAVLATLPVRVWTLKTGYTYQNGTKAGSSALTLANFKSMKEFWRMSVIANVDMGVLTRVDGSVDTFTGERVFCDTEMWANYGNMTATTAGLAYYNAWDGGHVHTAEAVEDLPATCTEHGYTGRTYCEVCASVVEWGTTEPATGHSYELTDGVLKCACGKLFSGVHTDGKTYIDGIVHADGWDGDSYYRDGVLLTGVQIVENTAYDFGEDGISKGVYTGLFEVEDNLYYAVVGALKSGWIFEENNYYYFDKTTYAAADGIATVEGYTYEFENRILVDGAWVSTDAGMKMMWAGKWCVTEWITVKGNTYYFNHLSVAVTGPTMIKLSTGGASQLAIFDENGVFQSWVTDTGLVNYGGTWYYLNEGIGVYAGLIELDGHYYYINSQFKAVTGTYYVTKANGLKDAGEYQFDSDGKMIVLKNGVYTDEDGQIRYYVNNVATYAGLVQDADGNYYYINSSLKAVRGTAYYVTKTNGLLPVAEYLFGADGKMIIEEPEEPDEPVVPEEPVVKQGLIIDEDGYARYYVDGVATYAGLVQDAEGNYYYINSTKKAVRGTLYVVTKTNGLLPSGEYLFDTDGKMVNPPAVEPDEPDEPVVPEEPVVKQGLVTDEDGYIRYYVDGVATYAGLVQDDDGNFYYINSTLKAVRGTLYVVTKTNGLLPVAQYLFGTDGKMVNPPV